MTERKRERPRLTLKTGRSLTKQEFGDECDVNNVVARFATSRELPRVNSRTPLYGDFSMAQDLQTVMNAVTTAQQNFAALPSDIRAAAGHDPVRFLEMCGNDDDLARLKAMGLSVEDGLPEFEPEEQAEEKTAPVPSKAASDAVEDSKASLEE